MYFCSWLALAVNRLTSIQPGKNAAIQVVYVCVAHLLHFFANPFAAVTNGTIYYNVLVFRNFLKVGFGMIFIIQKPGICQMTNLKFFFRTGVDQNYFTIRFLPVIELFRSNKRN